MLHDAFAGARGTLYLALDVSFGAADVAYNEVWYPLIIPALEAANPERIYAMGFSHYVTSSLVLQDAASLKSMPLRMSGGTLYDSVVIEARRDRRTTGERGPHRLVIVTDMLGHLEERNLRSHEFELVWLTPKGIYRNLHAGRVIDVLPHAFSVAA